MMMMHLVLPACNIDTILSVELKYYCDNSSKGKTSQEFRGSNWLRWRYARVLNWKFYLFDIWKSLIVLQLLLALHQSVQI